jgi:hypothetical protein
VSTSLLKIQRWPARMRRSSPRFKSSTGLDMREKMDIAVRRVVALQLAQP